jgi:hypothetical protein
MGYEEIGKGALQDHNAHAVIGFQFPAESVEFQRQSFIEKIYRRVINAGEYDSIIEPELEAPVVGILHSKGPFQ